MLTEEQFNAEVEKGLADVTAGRVVSVKELRTPAFIRLTLFWLNNILMSFFQLLAIPSDMLLQELLDKDAGHERW
jgi:hypothetical protein